MLLLHNDGNIAISYGFNNTHFFSNDVLMIDSDATKDTHA